MNNSINYEISERVFNDLQNERRRQEIKWGEQNHDNYKWLAIIQEEVGETAEQALEEDFARQAGDHRIANQHQMNMRKELIEVAASALAAVECIDRKYFQPRKFDISLEQ
jgi:hypothetical protein